MRKVLVMVAILMLVTMIIPAQLRLYCPTDTYSTWLTSQAKRGPADLVTEKAIETKQQKFTLSYALVNVGDDVIQVQVEEYRFLDEDAPNEGWKLEQTKTFYPPYAEATPVIFQDLKKGKTYGIHLSVTTNIPSIASDGVFPPDTISVKTVYFLWDKNTNTHLSATSSISEDKKKFFKVSWASSDCSVKGKIRIKHSSGAENPILETASHEISFPETEFKDWPMDDTTSVSVDSMDSENNLIGTTEIGVIIKPPCEFCEPLPCIKIPPEDPADDLLATTTLNNGIITAVIQSNYGGAIKNLKWNADGRELVDSQDDGVLIQVDAARANDLWIDHGYIFNNRERWEDHDDPTCDPGNKMGQWLPTQGGSFHTISSICGSTNQNWTKYFYPYSSTAWWGRALQPKQAVDTDGPYVYYTKDFLNWLPMDQLTNTADSYNGQAMPVMSAEIHLVNKFNGTTINNVSGLQLKSKFRLTCPCMVSSDQNYGANCWCQGHSELNSYGVLTKGYEFDAIVHSWYFFGSTAVRTTYRYNPQEPSDPYYLSLEAPCTWGVKDCADNFGWRNNNDFAPFSLLRTTSPNSSGKYVWILVYQVENDMGFTDKSWELARVLRFQSDGVIKGSVHMPFYILRQPSITMADGAVIPANCTNCGLKTTGWRPSPSSEWITTYVILGTKRNNVLCALYRLSGGKWPKVRNGQPLPCQVLEQGL